MTDLVTVGIPFFNSSTTILKAVRSVLAQSYENWKLILVDDGSTDGSADLMQQINDSRIRLVSDGRNLGLASRLNQIAALAESPLLARMDADDLMHPQRLEIQVAALAARQQTDLVCSGAISIDAHDSPTGYRASLKSPSVAEHFLRSPYVHPSVLGRTEWFRTHPYDSNFRRCQDQELWVRTVGERVVTALDEPLIYLREAGTVPAAKYSMSMAGTRRVLRRHGRERLGPVGAGRLYTITLAKQVTYWAAERFNATDRLVRSRSAPISPSEQEHHAALIHQVLATRIPGIDV